MAVSTGKESNPKKTPYKAPKFVHLHKDKALKLKREWIAKQKIKNQYRATVRKEHGTAASGHDEESASNENSDNEGGEVEPSARSSLPVPRSIPSQLSTSASSSKHPLRRKSQLQNVEPATSSTPSTSNAPTPEQVRELMRDAYSQSSLHTYKSDPLHKRAEVSSRGGERGRGRGGGRGRGVPTHESRGGGSGGSRGGRGQPDMRKRMGALLAHIQSSQASSSSSTQPHSGPRFKR